MSRKILGMVLLANLLFFSWMRWGAQLTETADTLSVQAEINPGQITLLNGQADTEHEGAASGVAAAQAESTPALATLALNLDSALTLPASSAQTASAVTASAVLAAAPAGGKPGMAAQACAEWGEFSGDDLARAELVLGAMKLGERMGRHSVEHSSGYWVYLAPMKKQSDREKAIAQLKRHGVAEFFVVQEKGKWQNAISLGVFKTEEAARKYRASVAEKGISGADVGKRMSKLHFTVFALKALDKAETAKLNAMQKDFPGSELKFSECNN